MDDLGRCKRSTRKDVQMNRRTFLKIAGVTVAGAVVPLPAVAKEVIKTPIMPLKSDGCTITITAVRLNNETIKIVPQQEFRLPGESPSLTWWREANGYSRDDMVKVNIKGCRELFECK